MGLVEITYFSDILCIWAYASQARINAIKEEFVDRVRIEHRFCSIFGDTERKITSNWKDSGGYEGFNSHLRHVAKRFPHIEVHPEIWLKTRPATSASTHLFIKAIQQWGLETAVATRPSAPTIFDQVTWAFRCAFFRDCRDIARWDTQCEIAEASAPISTPLNDAFTVVLHSPAWLRTTRTLTGCESKAVRASF